MDQAEINQQEACRKLAQEHVYNSLSMLFYALQQEMVETLEDYDIVDFYTTEQEDEENPGCGFEVYEQWNVSDWLAFQLQEANETVREFFGMHVWLRCTTGQSVYMDSCFEQIVTKRTRALTESLYGEPS